MQNKLAPMRIIAKPSSQEHDIDLNMDIPTREQSKNNPRLHVNKETKQTIEFKKYSKLRQVNENNIITTIINK